MSSLITRVENASLLHYFVNFLSPAVFAFGLCCIFYLLGLTCFLHAILHFKLGRNLTSLEGFDFSSLWRQKIWLDVMRVAIYYLSKISKRQCYA